MYYVQFGAFTKKENAESQKNRLANELKIDTSIKKSNGFYTVVSDCFESLSVVKSLLVLAASRHKEFEYAVIKETKEET